MIDIEMVNAPLAGNSKIDVYPTGDCWNYVLQGISNCDYSAPYETLLLNVLMNPIQYINVEEGIEDEAGTFTRSLWVQRRIFSFDAEVDSEALEWLQAMKGFDELYFGRASGPGSGANRITNLQIAEAQNATDFETSIVTVSFEDLEYLELTGCCGSAYAGSPFEDPCPPDGTGEPDPEDPCNDFELTLTYDGNAITADATGGPAGNVGYRWYYDATGSGVFQLVATNVSMVVPAGSGIYRVEATKAGGCQDVDAIMVQDICSLFTVVLSYQFGIISSQVIAGQGNPEYTWVFIDDVGTETVLADTGAELEPTETGLYRLEVIDGTDCEGEGICCEGEATIYVEILNECAFEVAITDNGDGTYTINEQSYTGSDTPTYRWEKETTSGIANFGTSQTITPDEQGVYRGYITLDGCEVGGYVLVMGDCVAFKGFIEAVIPGASSYTLYAGAIDAPGAVDYKWYQWTGSMYALIGSGSSVNTTQVGQVKLVATSGVCEKVDYAEIAMDFDDMYYYQKFILTGGEPAVTVTEFTLPDVVNEHPDRIAYLMEVVQNGVEQVYDHEEVPGSLQRLHFSIDGQDVQFNPAYSRAGSIIVVKMKKV